LNQQDSFIEGVWPVRNFCERGSTHCIEKPRLHGFYDTPELHKELIACFLDNQGYMEVILLHPARV